MISNLPIYVNIVFILATLLTIFFFYKATSNSKITLVIIFTWTLLQAALSLSGFYTITDTFPPRFALIAPPAILFIIGLFVSAKGRNYINSLDAKTLTLLHIVRIPVEICLYWLFIYKSVPQLMTFEGRNFDIFSGITAPFVFYFGYVKNYFSKTMLLLWNFICLGLLLNIVFNAVLSAPSVFQQFGFDQPNKAIFYFPYVWLPACIVPLVLTAHLICIRKILLKK